MRDLAAERLDPGAGAVFVLLRGAAADPASALDDAVADDRHRALSHDHVVAFGRASGEMQARADQPTPRGINAASGGEMIMGQGAVPILRNGVVIGACGVGGGTSQEDEDCARAGVELL